MANIQWPSTILPPRRVMCDPVYATTGGGRSLTAIEQIIASDAGYWAITLDEIPCASPVQKQVARALSVQMEGRLNGIDVPIYDSRNAPLASGQGFGPITGIPWSDPTSFSDGSLFQQGPIDASAAATAALGSNVVLITITTGGILQPGQHFSYQGASRSRLERIKTATLTTGTTYSCTVWPPLREAIPNATLLNFNDPRLTCRLKTDGEMQSFVDDYAGRTLAKVDFVELLP